MKIRHLAACTFGGILACVGYACGDDEAPAINTNNEANNTANNNETNNTANNNGRPTSYRTEVFTEGGVFRPANGIEVNADGNVVVANFFGRKIDVVDPDDGTIIDSYGFDLGVETPDDVAVAPDGTIYYGSLLDGKVGRIDPQGNHTIIAELPPGANPLAYSADDRLFVGLCFLGDALYEVDPTGTDDPRLIAENIGSGCGVNGMDFSPTGELFAPQPFLGRIVRVDTSSGALDIIAEGLSTSLFGVAFDSQGTLYAVDGQVVRTVDIDQGTTEVFAELPFEADNLDVGPNDRLFVSSYSDGALVEVLANGDLRTIVEGGLTAPMGIAAAPDAEGNPALFVGNLGGVAEVSAETGTVQTVRPGPGLTVFSMATRGDLGITASYFSNTVTTFERASNAPMNTLLFQAPVDAVPYGDEDLIVSELATGRVIRWSPSSSVAVVLEDVDVPTGLAINADTVYVADFMRGELYAVDLAADPPTARDLATGLDGPYGVAYYDGRVFVYEAIPGRIKGIDVDTGATIIVSEDPSPNPPQYPGQPPFGFFRDLTVDDAGVLYVTDHPANRLLRITPE